MRFLVPVLAAALFAATPFANAQATGQAASDPASRLNAPRSESIAGNAVDAATGAFIYTVPTIIVQGGRAMDFPLLYHSLATMSGGRFGPGWTHPYESSLSFSSDGDAIVHWDAYRRNTYRNTSGNSFEGADESALYDRVVASTNIFTVTRRDGTAYEFDRNNGRLREIRNHVGQEIRVQYDSDGRPNRVIEDITGKDINLIYDPSGQLVELQDPAGARTLFAYNSAGSLDAIHSPATFDTAPITLTGPVPFPPGSSAFFTLDVSGPAEVGAIRLDSLNLAHADAANASIILESPRGTVVNITSRAGRPSATVFDFDDVLLGDFAGEDPRGRWRLRISDGAPGNSISGGELNQWRMFLSGPTYPTYFVYDSQSRLRRIEDSQRSRILANTYDFQGRVVAQDDGLGATPVSQFSYTATQTGRTRTIYFDRLENNWVYEHDFEYHLRRFIDPLGGETIYEYDANGNRISLTDALERISHFEYDASGNLTAMTDPTGATARMTYSGRNLRSLTDALGNTTRFSYDDNNVVSVEDALGNVTERTFNSSSQPTGIVLPPSRGRHLPSQQVLGYAGGMLVNASHRDPMAGSAGLGYEPMGRVEKITDSDGFEHEVEYDSRGHLVRTTDPLGNSNRSEYDHRSRLVKQIDAKGNVTEFRYNGNNLIAEIINALGHSTVFEYDAEDHPIRMIDPEGNVIEMQFDDVGRMVEKVDGEGNVRRTRYDAVGNVIALFDADDEPIRKITYDDRDLPIVDEDAYGNKTVTNYDAAGRAVAYEDPSGRLTRATYDALGRLMEVRDALGRTVSNDYLAEDLVSSVEDGRGRTVSFDYDEANRMRSVNSAGTQVTISYNGRDAVTREVSARGVVREYEYNDAGQRSKKTTEFGTDPDEVIEYFYDDNGNSIAVQTDRERVTPFEPEGPSVSREYDRLDRMIVFRNERGRRIRYLYDRAGNLAFLVYSEEKFVRYEYDSARRLTQMIDWANRVTRFEYDANGRVTRIEFPNGTERLMEYDKSGRVTRRRDLASDGMAIVDYSYILYPDGRIDTEGGAPLSTRYQPTPVSMTYGNANRLTQFNGGSVTTDADGKITRGPLGTTFANFSFDRDNNLIGAAGDDYFYDVEDRLTGYRTSTGMTTLTTDPLPSLARILEKQDPDGAITSFVYGIGLTYEELPDGSIRVFHFDRGGSTVALSGDDGTPVGWIAYGPYGEIAARTGDTDTPFLFGGLFGVYTGPNGLSYMRFRWYSPQTRRFINQDAHFGDIAAPASLNRYAFASGDPINFTDPSGEIAALCGAVGGAVVGVVAAVVSETISQSIKNGRFTLAAPPLADLAGAALGGAVTGAVIATCGPCALGTAPLGTVVGVGVAAGVAGGAVGNITKQGISLAAQGKSISEFDWADFGVEVVVSGAFGAIPIGGKGGKAIISGSKIGTRPLKATAGRTLLPTIQTSKNTSSRQRKRSPGSTPPPDSCSMSASVSSRAHSKTESQPRPESATTIAGRAVLLTPTPTLRRDPRFKPDAAHSSASTSICASTTKH